MQSVMVLYLWQHSYSAQVAHTLGCLKIALSVCLGRGSDRPESWTPCRHSEEWWWPLSSSYPFLTALSPLWTVCIVLIKNMLWKIAALRLARPGAPTHTELAGKLFPLPPGASLPLRDWYQDCSSAYRHLPEAQPGDRESHGGRRDSRSAGPECLRWGREHERAS